MSDDEQRLLEQIRANPDDDEPRLVYADLLLARGDARGEYIQLAIASELTPRQSARLTKLRRNEHAWAEELGCQFPEVHWDRGFPHQLWGTALDYVAHRDVLRRLPIIGLTISDQQLSALAALPELASIRAIDLSTKTGSTRTADQYAALPTGELAALCASQHLRGLRNLTIGPHGIDDGNASVLASARWFRELEVLHIGQLTGEAFAVLLEQELPRLRELLLGHAFLGERGGRAFAEARLPGLATVSFANARLGGAGARLVLGSRTLASVRELTMYDDEATGGGVVLGASPYTHALRELTLQAMQLDTADGIGLASGSGSGFPELGSLGLTRNQIGDAGAVAFASSSRFPVLAGLYLGHNRLTRDGALALANRSGMRALTDLWLYGNPLSDAPFDEIRALFAREPALQID